MEIENELQNPRQTTERLSSRSKKASVKQKPTDWLGTKRSALMVVASLIATVAFQEGLTRPGGIWQDDYTIDGNGNQVRNPHSVGQSVMAYHEPGAYGLFMIFNTIAFLLSLSIILLLVSGLPLNRMGWMWAQMVIIWIITAQVAMYFITLKHMSSDYVMRTLRMVTEISVLTWPKLMSVVFVGNIVRMNLWVLRNYGYIEQKERSSESIEDDQEDAIE